MNDFWFVLDVILIVWGIDESGSPINPGFQTLELPWHCAYPITWDNIRMIVSMQKQAPEAGWAIYTWGIRRESES